MHPLQEMPDVVASMSPSMSHPQNFRKHREVAISRVQTTVVRALQQMCCSCSRNLGFKGPDLKIWKNVVMDYFNAPPLDLTRGKEELLQQSGISGPHKIRKCFTYSITPVEHS